MSKPTALTQLQDFYTGGLYREKYQRDWRGKHAFYINGVGHDCLGGLFLEAYDLFEDSSRNIGFVDCDLAHLSPIQIKDLTSDEAQILAFYEMERDQDRIAASCPNRLYAKHPDNVA